MSMTIILSNLVFSIGGFIFGFVMGRIGQRVEEVSEAIVDEEKTSTIDARKSRFSWRQVIGVVLLLLALGSTIASALVTGEQRRIISCQAEFNKAYRLALAERTQAANEERKSTRALWGALLDPGATTETRREAATRYYEALAQGDQTRAEHPLPASDSC